MNEIIIEKKNSFTDFMGKMEQIGFLLLNQESVKKSAPEPFHDFMNGQDLI